MEREDELLRVIAFLVKANKQNSEMILALSDILLEVEKNLLDFVKLQEEIIRKK